MHSIGATASRMLKRQANLLGVSGLEAARQPGLWVERDRLLLHLDLLEQLDQREEGQVDFTRRLHIHQPAQTIAL